MSSEITKSELKKMMNLSNAPLSEDVVLNSSDTLQNIFKQVDKTSQSKSLSYGNKETTAIILSSRRIEIELIPEGVKNRVISGLSLRQPQESDEFITIIEHKCIVAGSSQYVDPDFVIPEFCATIYETYIKDEEESMMKTNRICDVTMVDDNYGMITSTPSEDLDFEDAGVKPKNKKKSKEKFEKGEKPAKLGDLVAPDQ